MSPAAARHQNKFLRMILAPYRALCQARDFYVRSITECGQPPSIVPSRSKSHLPRSVSTASSLVSSVDSEDYRELVRAASVRTMNEVEVVERRERRGVARSASVGMGRIDEEAPFEGGFVVGQSGFVGVAGVRKNGADLFYPRSKSHALMRRNAAF